MIIFRSQRSFALCNRIRTNYTGPQRTCFRFDMRTIIGGNIHHRSLNGSLGIILPAIDGQ